MVDTPSDDTDNKPSEALSEEERLAAEWAAMADEDIPIGKKSPNTNVTDKEHGRILNQEEIDSLLGFDNEGDHELSGIEAIINSALVSYERLPMLEVVFDRLVRLMSTSLRNFTSDNVEVTIDSMSAIRFGDYLNSIPLPAILSVFKIIEWDNYGLMVVDSSLIYSVVDVLLGGRRGTAAMAIEGRPYTTIERNLVERLTKVILDDVAHAFEPLQPVKLKIERLETNPRFAAIARPANAAILTKLRIDMEDRGGRLDLIIPYATLEPVRDVLLQMFMGEKFGRDSIWEGHLATELWATDIPIDVVLEKRTIKLNEVLAWEEGTQIMLEATPRSQVTLRCGEVELFQALMGKKGNKVAVKINKKLLKHNHNYNFE